MRSVSPFVSALASTRDQLASMRFSRERSEPRHVAGSKGLTPQQTLEHTQSQVADSSGVYEFCETAQHDRQERLSSPHLRGNSQIATAMRNELLLHSSPTLDGETRLSMPARSAVSPPTPLRPSKMPQAADSHAAPRLTISLERQASMEQMLQSMGFTDRSWNEKLLRKHEFALDKVLDELINNIERQEPVERTQRFDDTSSPTLSKLRGRNTTVSSMPSGGQESGGILKQVCLSQLWNGFSCMMDDLSDELMVRSMLEEEDAEKKLSRLPPRHLQSSGDAIGTHVFARSPQQDMRSKIASNSLLSKSQSAGGDAGSGSFASLTSFASGHGLLSPTEALHSDSEDRMEEWRVLADSGISLPSVSACSNATANSKSSLAQADSFTLSQDGLDARSQDIDDLSDQPTSLCSVYVPIPSSQMKLYTPISGYSEMLSQSLMNSSLGQTASGTSTSNPASRSSTGSSGQSQRFF